MTDEQIRERFVIHLDIQPTKDEIRAYRLGVEQAVATCRKQAQEARAEADASLSPSESSELIAMAAGAERCATAIERGDKG